MSDLAYWMGACWLLRCDRCGRGRAGLPSEAGGPCNLGAGCGGTFAKDGQLEPIPPDWRRGNRWIPGIAVPGGS